MGRGVEKRHEKDSKEGERGIKAEGERKGQVDE